MISELCPFNNPAWAERYFRRHSGIAHKNGVRFAKLLKRRGFKGGRILDSGCGFGAMVIELAKAFPEAEVVGIDQSDPLLETARKLAYEAGLSERVSFEKGDVTKLPYGDESFDAVVNIYMAHHVEDPSVMLAEIERVLKPGCIALIEDIKRSWLGLFESAFREAFSAREARELLNRSALREGRFLKGFYWWRFETGGGAR